MNTVKEVSGMIPQHIATAVNLAMKGTPEEVKQKLPAMIESLLAAAEICKSAAEDTENAFGNIAGLAQVRVPITIFLRLISNGSGQRKWSLRARIKYVES
jgi:hypothetical protein